MEQIPARKARVHRGDVLFIETGTLHAIGAGILIAEIQQSSNLTYRIYDYGRPGKDGKPRELHIAQAMDVTRLERPQRSARPQGEPEEFPGGVSTLLASCGHLHREENGAARRRIHRRRRELPFPSLPFRESLAPEAGR